MTSRYPKRGFASRPGDAESWVKASPSSMPSRTNRAKLWCAFIRSVSVHRDVRGGGGAMTCRAPRCVTELVTK